MYGLQTRVLLILLSLQLIIGFLELLPDTHLYFILIFSPFHLGTFFMKLYIGTDVNSSAALFQADYFLPKVPLPFSVCCLYLCLSP